MSSTVHSDPLQYIKIRAATEEESTAAKGGFLWRVISTPCELTCKLIGLATLYFNGPNGLALERSCLEKWINKACHLVGLRPEEPFLETFYNPIGNMHKLRGSTKAMRAVLAHHRNDELFVNNRSMTQMFELSKKIFPDDNLSKDDFMLTCSPEQTAKYRDLLHAILKDVKPFTESIDTAVNQTLAAWEKRCEEGGEINASQEMRLFTSRVICEIMFGDDSACSKITEAIDFMNNYIYKTILRQVTKDDEDRFRDTIASFREAVDTVLQKAEIPLFREKHDLSTAQMKMLIFMIFFAGQETTASLLAWILKELGRSPEEQQLARANPERLNAIFHREIGNFPPAFGIGRTLRKDVCIEYQLKGEGQVRTLVIPKGQTLGAGIKKQAELELASGSDRLNSHRWLPFGSGAHHCPGEKLAKLEIERFLKALLANYQIRLLYPEKVDQIGLFTLKLREDVRIRIEALDGGSKKPLQ